MAIETTIWMNTSNPSKAMAPAMVTEGPWVATWSHWNSAATRAATETVAATSVPGAPDVHDRAEQRRHQP